MARKLKGERLKKIKNTMIANSPGIQCHYCGKGLNRGSLTVDHVVPLSAGGAYGLSNIVPACCRCNGSKGSKSYGEFVKKIDPNCSYLRSVAHG